MSARRRIRGWTVLFAAAGAAAVAAVVWGVSARTFLADEAWFGQVAARVARGETLYKDVWIGVTPLSVWATALLGRVFGTTLVAVKVFSGVAFVLSAVLVVLVARTVRLSLPATVATLALLLVTSPPGRAGAGSGYNTGIVPLTLACLLAAVTWWESEEADRPALAAVAGALAAVAFGVKQNAGVLMMLAFTGTVGAAPLQPGGRRRSLGVGWAAFGVGFLVLAVAVAFTAGVAAPVSWFLKGRYLSMAGVGFAAAFLGSWRAAFAEGGWRLPAALSQLLAFPSAAAGVLVPAIAVLRAPRRVGCVGLAFGVAAVLCGFPRYDLPHLSVVAPLAIASAAVGWSVLSRDAALPGRIAWWVAGIAVGVAVVATVGVTLDAARTRVAVASAVSGVGRVAPAEKDRIDGGVAALRAAPGDRVFVISAWSGLYSLSAGLSNPLPWDYPLSVALPPSAARQLAERVDAGAVDGVWIDSAMGGSGWQPLEMVLWVRRNMSEATSTPYGTLYVPR